MTALEEAIASGALYGAQSPRVLADALELEKYSTPPVPPDDRLRRTLSELVELVRLGIGDAPETGH